MKIVRSQLDYPRFSAAKRVVSLFLITTFTLPAFLFGLEVKIDARTPGVSVPVSEPPQSFVIGGNTESASLSIFVATFASAIVPVIGSVLGNGDTLPNDGTLPKARPSKPELNKEPVALSVPIEPAPPVSQPSGVTEFDFDGDHKADMGRWRTTTNEFKVRFTDDGTYMSETIASTGAKPAPGDFDGDGKYDVVVFNAGTWTGKKSSDGSSISISLGASGDTPQAGDYDKDGKTDAAVFRPSNGTWYVKRSSDGVTVSQAWGISGDIPAAGDFDGDGQTDHSIFRPSDGNWWIIGSQAGWINRAWGLPGDIPVPADFDGDGKSDMAVYRPSNGTWYVAASSANFAPTFTQMWGNNGDQPVPGDYLGDASAELAVWRPTTGEWYIFNPDDSSIAVFPFGVKGDLPVPAAYLKPSGFDVPPDQIGKARLLPRNATGDTNLYSQNFAWGRNLVSLPGRAGLDLNLGIAYNSLVWTKVVTTVGTTMVFDADAGNPTPGFRFGFPEIEPVFNNDVTGKYTYLMITPSGERIEFRQTSLDGVYETADSNYSQLQTIGSSDPNYPAENLGIIVTTTDGTQMSYAWAAGTFHCTRIKDRNGNYIDAAYDYRGNLLTVTDTLGRVVNVNYNDLGLPSSITQTWSTGTHTWASFAYTTKPIDTNFGGDVNAVAGPADGWNLNVLEKITYGDGSATKFVYNSFGQVQKVENHAPDSTTSTPHVLNYTETNLDSPGTNLSDCPRFTETRIKAENFNSGNPVVVQNRFVPSQSVSVGGQSVSGTKVQSWVTGHPNDLVSNSFYGGSGWNEGLPLATEDCLTTDPNSCTSQKRWTWTNWTQDDTGVSYPKNPRVTETRVGDGTNTKKTTIDYDLVSGTNIAIFGLPSEVKVYKADLTNTMKRVEYDYDLSSTYTSKRIIGLPYEIRTYGFDDGTQSEQLTSKTNYTYDQGDFSDTTLSQNITPTQHDTSYSSSFVAGRGNLTNIKKWDVVNTSSYVESQVRYNTAGSVVAQITPWDGTNTRTVKFGYSDFFNSTVGVSTYAYPTTITDPAGNSSRVKYRYDFGANVEATSPAPAGQTVGKITKRTYYSDGRLEKDAVYAGTTQQAYTRYEYPANGIQQKVFSTLVDVNNNNQADSADEVVSESWTDGAGRVRHSRRPHTFNTDGSVATWAASLAEYDILGRVKRSSVPTEVTYSNINDPDTKSAAGDDATRGFLWTYQKYDWKDRVVRKINTDGTDSETLNDSDILISYAGCGCAGGVDTTVESERVPIPGTSNFARRKQKSYSDILGRTTQTESFEWDGTTVHSTVVNKFNGRDQNILITQYAGSTSSSVHQETTTSFDGYGRLASTHKPEQHDSGDNPKYTAFSYNSDGSIHSMTDGRGVITNYGYNNRGLLTGITWNVGNTGVIDVPDLTYEYDNAGNRVQMIDGLGQVDYEYNSLSQMTAETRDFTDTMANSPISGGKFKLVYAYHLGGQLKSYTDPFDQQITYANDKVGRVDAITGSSFGGVTNYANNPEYRAWGSLKQVDYASGLHLELNYNGRLQTSSYNLIDSNQVAIINRNYTYYSDRKLKYLQDVVSPKFDRLNTYNNVGLIKDGLSGGEARGETVAQVDRESSLPYRQSYGFDAFGHMTESTNMHWGTTAWAGEDFDQTFQYVNNRIQETGWTFDDDGRNTRSISGGNAVDKIFDAAGKLIRTSTDEAESRTFNDGNGAEGKRETYAQDENEEWVVQSTRYFIRSSVLKGRVISEAWANGKKHRSFVKGIGSGVAVQSAYASPTAALNELVFFEFSDSSGMSYRTTDKLGAFAATGDGGEGSPIETDPIGGSVGLYTPYFEPIVYSPDPELPDLIPYNHNGPNMPGQDFDSLYSFFGSRIADLPGFGTNWGSFLQLDERQYGERVTNARFGLGFVTDEEFAARAYADAAAQTAAGAAAGHEGMHSLGDSGDATAGADGETGGGSWVDQNTADVDLNNLTVTVYGGGYFDSFGDGSGGSFIRDGGSIVGGGGVGGRGRDLNRDILGLTLIGHLAKVTGKCADALNALKLTSKKILEAFDKADFFPQQTRPERTAKSQLFVGGKIRTRNGIDDFIANVGETGSPSWLLHELAHQASKLDDRPMYNAIKNAGIEIQLVTSTKVVKKKTIVTDDYSKSVSNFFNTHCK